MFQVRKDVGDVDILINNAGIVSGNKFLDTPDSSIERTMSVNIMAHFWVSQVPLMKQKILFIKFYGCRASVAQQQA